MATLTIKVTGICIMAIDKKAPGLKIIIPSGKGVLPATDADQLKPHIPALIYRPLGAKPERRDIRGMNLTLDGNPGNVTFKTRPNGQHGQPKSGDQPNSPDDKEASHWVANMAEIWPHANKLIEPLPPELVLATINVPCGEVSAHMYQEGQTVTAFVPPKTQNGVKHTIARAAKIVITDFVGPAFLTDGLIEIAFGDDRGDVEFIVANAPEPDLGSILKGDYPKPAPGEDVDFLMYYPLLQTDGDPKDYPRPVVEQGDFLGIFANCPPLLVGTSAT